VWVAEEDGQPIGFAACEPFDGVLHLWQIAVRRDRQGQGAGRALITVAAEAGRARGFAAITLTTFREIAWNGPFYARLGFRELAEADLDSRLRAVIARERTLGLDVAARCAMRLEL
jgi:GNAT superfamily N-acetyltransferase